MSTFITGKSVRLLAPKIVIGMFLAMPSHALAQEASNWQGWHAGLFGGYGTGRTDIVGNRFTYDTNSSRNEVNHVYDGGILGIQTGYNWVNGSFLIGPDVEFAATSLGSDKVFNADNDIDNVDLDWYAVIGARAGIVFDRTLIYGKVGLALAQIYNIGGDMDASGFDYDDAHIRRDVFTGFAFGGGLEQQLAQDLSLRFEFLTMDFGDYSQANNQSANQIYQVSNGRYNFFKIGITKRF